MSERSLYLPSTPLNILLSLVDILRTGCTNNYLLLIDQKRPSVYIDLLKQSGMPFQRVEELIEPRGILKLYHRKKQFEYLSTIASQFCPTRVAVGSDRRIEFQFLMHFLSKNSIGAKGIYLDDGLYTYDGWPYRWDKWLTNLLTKKLLYGLWWEEPISIGASSWIDEGLVFRPKSVVKALESKSLSAVDPLIFKNGLFRSWIEKLVSGFSITTGCFLGVKHIFLIPHPSNMSKIPGFKERLLGRIIKAKSDGDVMVKYHPRHGGSDPLNLSQIGVKVLPVELAFEFVLPMISPGAFVWGDVTTALLTTKWIRPDLSPIAVLSKSTSHESHFIQLFKSLGVEVRYE